MHLHIENITRMTGRYEKRVYLSEKKNKQIIELHTTKIFSSFLSYLAFSLVICSRNMTDEYLAICVRESVGL